MTKSEVISRINIIETLYRNTLVVVEDAKCDSKALEELQQNVYALDWACQCVSSDKRDIAGKTTYQQGWEDAIDEFVKRIYESLGIADATKFGNKNEEQRQNSYSTYMCYEIKDDIDDVAYQMKEEKNEDK